MERGREGVRSWRRAENGASAREGAPAPALRGSSVQGGREPRGGGWGLNDTTMWVPLMVVDLGDAV
jgi:hypothetical protein